MRCITEQLWLGHSGDLRDARSILDAGIEAIVELADSEPFAVLPRDLVRCRFPLSDGGDNPPWLLRLAVDSCVALLRANVPLLICCSGGMSRSVCIAAAALSVVEGYAFSAVLSNAVGEGPADVCPRLVLQIERALKIVSD